MFDLKVVKKVFWVVTGVTLVTMVGWWAYAKFMPREETVLREQPAAEPGTKKFIEPKKTPHYESNVPEHEAVLAGVPVNVVVNFNFDLAPKSAMTIVSGGVEYGFGETVLDANKLGMRRKMATNAPDGIYTVRYSACWLDGSCHDGWFQFEIKRDAAAGFVDLTANREITINLTGEKFQPQSIRVKKGTKVIWVNMDAAAHTVNTDPHAGHNYFPPQNSKLLEQGDDFAVTFEEAGIYLYHCSVHAQTMRGQILVE